MNIKEKVKGKRANRKSWRRWVGQRHLWINEKMETNPSVVQGPSSDCRAMEEKQEDSMIAVGYRDSIESRPPVHLFVLSLGSIKWDDNEIKAKFHWKIEQKDNNNKEPMLMPILHKGVNRGTQGSMHDISHFSQLKYSYIVHISKYWTQSNLCKPMRTCLRIKGTLSPNQLDVGYNLSDSKNLTDDFV